MIIRAGLDEAEIDFVAVNDITDAATLAHLLKHDSVHGTLGCEVGAEGDSLFVGGRCMRVFRESDPARRPWKERAIDVVLECSGHFTDRDKAANHLQGGVSKVIISAPAKGADVTLRFGVNYTVYDLQKHNVISNASCTTNCLAPVGKVLHDTFRVHRGLMTTGHAYTNDQRIPDLPHKDLRRAERADVSRSLEDARAVVDALRSGATLLVFPEGGFADTPGLRPFRLGAFKAAVESAKPIVPVAVVGTRAIFGGGRMLPRRGTIEVTVAPPIPPRAAGWPEMVRLRDATRSQIAEITGDRPVAGCPGAAA
jgi:hypothetical protein